MKLNDLNTNLNEGPISGPAGFAARAKAKLQKHSTSIGGQDKIGAAKDAVFKQAQDIKKSFKVHLGSTGKKQVGMKTFLNWINQNFPDQSQGVLAAAKEIHTNLTFPDPKAPEAPEAPAQAAPAQAAPAQAAPAPAEKVSPEDAAAGQAKIDADAEEEGRRLNPDDTGIEGDGTKQDVKASKGDDEKPKVDTSASIYESRFQIILEAETATSTDQSMPSTADGEISDEPLTDNQIDTLILKGIQKQKELEGTGKATPKQQATKPEQAAAEPEAKAAEPEAKAAEPEAQAGKKAAAASAAAPNVEQPAAGGGISIDKSDAKKLKALLTKAHAGSDFDDKDRKVAAAVIKYLNKFV